MNIEDLTIKQAKELAAMVSGCGAVSSPSKRHGFEVGKSYFIRSVTHHYLGTVREITELCVVMDSCVWVADDGRFHKLLQGEWDNNSEREPYPRDRRVQIFFGGMLDAVEWVGEIPSEVR